MPLRRRAFSAPLAISLAISPAAVVACLAAALSSGAATANPVTPPTLAADPDYRRARAMIEAENFPSALRLLRGLETDHPEEAEVHSLVGFSLRKLGRTDEAFPADYRALELDPDHLGANEYLGELYVLTGAVDRARERLAVLEQACGRCEEFVELEAVIAGAD